VEGAIRYVPRRQVGLGFGQLLAPGLPLLHGFLLRGRRRRRRRRASQAAAGNGAAEHAVIVKGARGHALAERHGLVRREEGWVVGAGRRDKAVCEAVGGRILELDAWGRHGGRIWDVGLTSMGGVVLLRRKFDDALGSCSRLRSDT
jgi:hypothetical protein